MIDPEQQPDCEVPCETATIELARLTASALCDFTKTRLWNTAHASDALYLNHDLLCRPGVGRATYHRFDSASRRHLIVFGQKMIVDKWQSVVNGTGALERWLTVREIRRRGYFDGLVSLESVLLQTCLHEFAHLLQTVDRKRRYGSVHNEAFYTHLQRLHDTVDLNLARSQLRELLPQQLVGAPCFQQSIEKAEATQRSRSAQNFAAGDRVVFHYRQQLVQAVVLKQNRINCKLQGLGRHKGMIYRCHPSLLSPDQTTSS
ncbi:hypothetical protein [Allohahella marinimesophila]|uniref:SprT-like family protein n=1 Tax=Allohahella marinimesophila TaxID=1054972 RepID=A0ABP7NLP7_9GAMM